MGTSNTKFDFGSKTTVTTSNTSISFRNSGRSTRSYYDDDFVLELDEDSYRDVLYIPDLTMQPADVADAVHHMSKYYQQSQVSGIERVGAEWL